MLKCHPEHYKLCWAVFGKSALCTEHNILYIHVFFSFLKQGNKGVLMQNSEKIFFFFLRNWCAESVRISALFKQRHLKILALNSLDVVEGWRIVKKTLG